jgi:hypothetical protein
MGLYYSDNKDTSRSPYPASRVQAASLAMTALGQIAIPYFAGTGATAARDDVGLIRDLAGVSTVRGI